MKTDIEYLRTLDLDLQQAARREKWMQAAPSVRRGRSWGGWGTFAAGVIGLLVVAGLIGMIATNGGLGSSADSAGAGVASSTPAREQLGSSGATGATGSAGAAGAAPGFQTAPGNALAAQATGQSTDMSKIIRDGSMSVQVPKDDFSKGFAAATRIAQNNGGFVLSSQTRGQRRGTLVLRIPAKRFDDAMVALRAIGVVQAQSITGKDVTAQYIDLKARLENAIGQRTVLRNLMAEATTIQETITVQNRLSQVELEVEQIQGQLNFIDDQVAEATVRVEMHEEDAAQLQQTDVVENPSLGSAWDRSIQGFLNVVSAVVIGLGYLLPLAAIGLIVWLITAAVRRRRAAS
jgi:Domain of unknown function (DUF4349)